MDEIQKHEMIEAWLAGKLQGKALQDFENQIQNDQAFALEVKVHQEVGTNLENSNKAAVRQSLIEIRQKVNPDLNTGKSDADLLNNNKRFNFLSFLFLGFFILGIAYYFLSFDKNIPETKETPISQPEITPSPSTNKTLEPEVKKPVEKEKTPVLEKPTEEKKTSKEKKPVLIAADFQANSKLVTEMRDQKRGNGLKLSLSHPNKNTQWFSIQGQTPTLFRGTFSSKIDLSNRPIQIAVYSNKVSDYEQQKPIWKEELILTKTADHFSFSIQKNLNLKPGLYYYIFEDLEEEAYLWIGSVVNMPKEF